LSTHLKEKLERIELTIEKLLQESAKGAPIVVEGKKDTQALRELGVNGKILMLKTAGKNFLKATTEIKTVNTKEVIVLLYFDRRAKEATTRLQFDLERLKIKVNLRFWIELQALVCHEIQCIESLPNYLRTLHKKTQ
jgi:5S rRNA maturation endonuclease (ribonuclease M5)